MTWDYFISHASEDKQLVAEPLAHYLQSADFEVWYDTFALKVGDSLLNSINNGLAKSRFAIVTLSPAFFAKKWPQQELAGVFAIEAPGEKKILPVWHQITASEIAAYTPILADRLAVDTKKGLQFVAEQLIAASFPERLRGLPISSVDKTDEDKAASAKNAFRMILDSEPSKDDILMYLSGYPILLTHVLRYYPQLVPSFKLPVSFGYDFAVLMSHGVTGPMEVIFVILGPPSYDATIVNETINSIDCALGKRRKLRQHPANDYIGPPYFGEFRSLAETASAIQGFTDNHNIHWERPDTWSFSLLILTGRRSHTNVEERDAIAGGNRLRIDIASYDRLLDDHGSIYG